MEFHIPFKHILTAAVIHFIIGALWYAPFAFGRTWQNLVGLRKKDLPSQKKALLFAFASSMLIATGMAYIVPHFDAVNILSGSSLGVLIWLFFMGSLSLHNYAFQGKSVTLILIDNGYYLLGMTFLGSYFGSLV